MRAYSFAVLLFSLFCTGLALVNTEIPKDWENSGYDKSIDLVKSYVKERHDITARNIGSKPNDEYLIGFPANTIEDIAFVLGMGVSLNGKKSVLKTVKLDIIDDDKNVAYYLVQLPYPIAPQSEISFTVSIIVINQLYPVPEKAPIGADQTLRLNTLRYPISPYDTMKYSIGVLGVKNYEEITDKSEEPSDFNLLQHENQNLMYQSTTEVVPANTASKLVASFVKNEPLKYVNYLKRDLWVSHWSNALELEEYYELTNKGVQLESGFNRAEWFNGRYALKQYSAIENIRIPLPANDIPHNSMYFTDKVGNVSTSQIFDEELIIKPRFPIFGSWNYNFTIGWDFKLNEFLKSKGDEHILQVHLLDGIYDVTYEKVSLNVYLPEGAELIDYALPFSSIEADVSSEFSYMDYNKGHTKIEFEFENLVDELKTFEIVIRYKYTTWDMMHKPLTCAKYIGLALIALYALKRVDLTIQAKNTASDEEITETHVEDENENVIDIVDSSKELL